MRLGTTRLLRIYVARIFVGAVLGAFFGSAVGISVVDPPLLGAALGVLSGALDGAALMALGGGVHMFLPRTRLGRALDRAPLALAFTVRWLFYSAIILCIIGGKFGPRMTALIVGGGIGHALMTQMSAKIPTVLLVAIALMITLFFVLLDMMIRLVGDQTFRDLALGRYRHARHEERFFLFVDIAGSTPLAERIGPEAIHRFLREVFRLASDPIDDHGGEVYQHVGDEVVITWTLAEGRVAARPVACYFAIESALARAAKDFERDFGTVPRLRGALHAGPVITGEVGVSHRSIVFHGDVMNTTSRIENATRELDRSFLVSEDALNRLQGVDAYTFADLGPRQLRGREALLRLYAVGPGAVAPEPAARR